MENSCNIHMNQFIDTKFCTMVAHYCIKDIRYDENLKTVILSYNGGKLSMSVLTL